MKKNQIISGLAAAVLTLSGMGVVGFAEDTADESVTAAAEEETAPEAAVVDERVLGLVGGGSYYSELPYGEVDSFTDGDYEFFVISGTNNAWLRSYSGNAKNVTVPSKVKDGTGREYKVTALLSGLFNYKDITSVVIPEGVTSIGASTFAGNQDLSSVKLPSTLRGIGNYAFANCKAMKTVTLPSNLEMLGYGAFEYSGLTSISIPDSVKTIESYVFGGCYDLASAKLPSGLEELKHDLFYNCSKLTSVNLPSGLKTIGNEAFYNCSALSSVTIPSSVKTIDYGAFRNCKSLKTINGMSGVSEFDAFVFTGTAWLAARQAESPFVIVNGILLDATTAKGSVIVPAEATVINCYSFNGNKNITSVRFAGKIEVLRRMAFNGCSELASIDLGRTVQRLGNGVFYNCSTLETITLPASLRIIRANAFAGTYFRYITMPDYIEMLSKTAFKNLRSIPERITIVKKTGKLSKRELGDKLPCVKTLVVSDGITEIDSCFYTDNSLDKVYIPGSVTKIGERAFGYYLMFNDGGYVFTPSKQYSYSGKYNYSYMIDHELTIACYKGSAAETYAKTNRLNESGSESGMLLYSADGAVFGDANSDGSIDSVDLSLMQQYLADWNVVIDKNAADLDGDGDITSSDLSRLQQYLAGWKIVLGVK